MEINEILETAKLHYPMNFERIELLRQGGNATCAIYDAHNKYFLKSVAPAFSDTFRQSAEVNLYLHRRGFSAPRLCMTTDNSPFAEEKAGLIAIYEFLETTEINMENDAEEVGALIGELHRLMEDYSGELHVHDKAFYLDRYVNILKKKRYRKSDEFASRGERLWDKIKALPRGYSHGDMYSGNVARAADGKLYILDFDTSCIGLPMYDLALICNRTNYFDYDAGGLAKTASVYARLLPEYLKRRALSARETDSLYDMIALYHFALQATIIEVYGLDCVDDAFFDKQLEWLKRWELQRA